MKVHIEPGERDMTMTLVDGLIAENDADLVDVPEHMVRDLHRANVYLLQVERMISQHLLDTGQWDKAHMPQEWRPPS